MILFLARFRILSILCVMATSLTLMSAHAQTLDPTRASERSVAQAQFRELLIEPPIFTSQTHPSITQSHQTSAIPNSLPSYTPQHQGGHQNPQARLMAELPPKKQTASSLEQSYAARVIDSPRQFGYDFFDQLEHRDHTGLQLLQRLTQKPFGRVSGEYVLGIGDQLQIIFQGDIQERDIYTIDSNGFVIMPNFGPILAAGRSLESFTQDLESMAAQSFTATKAHVSLHSLKQIGVLVMGHVHEPGRQNLVHYNGLMDALSAAGGIRKSGSLRSIKLVRDGKSRSIDLYDFLLDGLSGADITLRDADRIIVPEIGPTIAITGDVKRPGIFELKSKNPRISRYTGTGAAPISLNEALFFAGGVTAPGYNRFVQMSPNANGFETIDEVVQTTPRILTPGSILQVSRGESIPKGQITLSGHVRAAGQYSLEARPTLSKLLTGTHIFKDDVYPLIGIVERLNKDSLSKELIGFHPLQVTRGAFDLRLEDHDEVRLYAHADIRALMDGFEAQKGAQDPTIMPTSKAAHMSLVSLSGVVPRADSWEFSAREEAFLVDASISVRGAVAHPGQYPVPSDVSLEDVLNAAGGVTAKADKRRIEVTTALLGEGYQEDGRSGTRRHILNIRETRTDTIPLQAGDTVLVPRRFAHIAQGDSVYIGGEVLNPGKYDLVRGETLLSLIERAGGVTAQAYPPGAIFSRERERRREQAQFDAAARDLERSLASSIEQDGKDINATQIAMVRELASELREIKAVGRITVEADPAVLSTESAQDILLESGDKVYIPKRPLTVRVGGEVLSPAALQFRSDKSASDYIREAGGTSYFADKSRIFVLFPDGASQPLNMGRWDLSSAQVMIPPGSTIVVPRDPKPFDFIETARDFTQILTNVAITGIFLDDIADDD